MSRGNVAGQRRVSGVFNRPPDTIRDTDTPGYPIRIRYASDTSDTLRVRRVCREWRSGQR
jgi:hypothetical protein